MKLKNYSHKLFNLIFTIILILSLTSCGLYRSAPVSEVPINDKDKRKKNQPTKKNAKRPVLNVEDDY